MRCKDFTENKIHLNDKCLSLLYIVIYFCIVFVIIMFNRYLIVNILYFFFFLTIAVEVQFNEKG